MLWAVGERRQGYFAKGAAGLKRQSERGAKRGIKGSLHHLNKWFSEFDSIVAQSYYFGMAFCQRE